MLFNPDLHLLQTRGGCELDGVVGSFNCFIEISKLSIRRRERIQRISAVGLRQHHRA